MHDASMLLRWHNSHAPVKHCVEGGHFIHAHFLHAKRLANCVHRRQRQPAPTLALSQIKHGDAGSSLVVFWKHALDGLDPLRESGRAQYGWSGHAIIITGSVTIGQAGRKSIHQQEGREFANSPKDFKVHTVAKSHIKVLLGPFEGDISVVALAILVL